MKNNYEVEVLELVEIHELPEAWLDKDYIQLLDKLDFGDTASIPPGELRDMASMALSDLDPEEAAELILELRFGDKLNVGQRKNLAEDLKGDRLWEEYAEINFHEEIFNVSCMMNWAFPKQFSEPDMIRIRLGVTAMNVKSGEILQAPTASFIARLLNDGMDEHNAIHRLFHDEIASNSFPESEAIIWKFVLGNVLQKDNSREIIVYTSWNWVDELKGVKEFQSTAYSD